MFFITILIELKLENQLCINILNKKIGFLGTGQMGGALITSFSKFFEKKSKILNLQNQQIKNFFYLFDVIQEKKTEYKNFGYKNICENESDLINNSDIIFLCVKPDLVQPILERNRNLISKPDSQNKKLLVSIAAGISINFMEQIFEITNIECPKIIRIMSNHLCSINESSSVYCTNKKCKSEDEDMVKILLQNVGLIKKVSENQINAFTALAGSGPAFVYLFVESLIDACILNGIDFNTSRDYSIQTVYAAAKYLKDKKEQNPSNLKYVVTTPKGTTIAGLEALEDNKFKYAVMQAISAATKRGKEIENEKINLLTKAKF